jgi:hypothetical protein
MVCPPKQDRAKQNTSSYTVVVAREEEGEGGVIFRSPTGRGDENPLRCQWMLRTSFVLAIIARRKSRAAFIVVFSGVESPRGDGIVT